MKSIKTVIAILALASLTPIKAGDPIPEFVPERDFVPGLIQPMGMVYQKDLLIGVRDRLAQAATSQEKIDILEEVINKPFTTENSREFLHRAKNNLDQANQILQEAIQQYEQPMLGIATGAVVRQR